MPYDDVQKFSEAAVNKAKLLKEQPGKYFLRSVMAGFFIVVAMIFSNVVGNVFQGSDPAWGKLLGGIVFAIAVLLIVFIGAELFTGNNLVMAFGAFDKKVSWTQVGKVWLVSYIGNFVGCLILSVIFVLAGASGTYAGGGEGSQRLYWEQTFHSCGRNVLPRHSLQLLCLPCRCLRHEMQK